MPDDGSDITGNVENPGGPLTPFRQKGKFVSSKKAKRCGGCGTVRACPAHPG